MKSIKTLIILLAGYLLLSLPLAAQPAPCAPGESAHPTPQNKEKLESARIAYFTSRMSLTPEEASKFWPVYNEYRKAMEEARRANRHEFHELRRMSEEGTASEINMKKQLMEYIDGCVKDDELERLYLDEFLKILPVEKVVLMYIAEEDFRIKMIKMWKKPGMEKKQSDADKDAKKPESR